MKLLHILFSISASIILTGSMVGCATTLSYDQARASYQAGDYQRSFKLLETLARNGDARAQYALGYHYYNGLGVSKDEILGTAWITKAACKHDIKANCALENIHAQNAGKK